MEASRFEPKTPRQELPGHFLDPYACSMVEVGALDSPTYNPKHFSLKFIDYTTKDGLIADNPGNPRYTPERLMDVDYAIHDGNYGSIPDRFDLAIANHVIEHIPDMIGWLKGLRQLLKQDGFLFLSVPDRRFTFDHLRPETRVSELLSAHREGRTVPTWGQIFDHFYYYRKVDTKEAWAGNIEVALATPRSSSAEAKTNADKFSNGNFVSLHCNVFTYQSFLGLIKTLKDLGELPFEHVGSQDALPNSNEFHIVLKATDT